MDFPKHKAILDIGSNTFHFVIYKIENDKTFTTVFRKRIICRLALQKQNGNSFLSEEDFIQTKKNILELQEIAKPYSATIAATATSAIREAINEDDFRERIKKTTGISIEILSGEREAFLIYKAILFSDEKNLSKNILCLDIGGGSTECILGKAGKINFIESMKLGAVRLSSIYFQNGDLDESKVEACRNVIKSELRIVKQKLHANNIDLVTGNSGTIHAVKALAIANISCLNFRNSQALILDREEVDEIVDLLLARKTIEERKTIQGIEQDRADVLPAGALILQGIFSELNITEVYLSDYSIREGKLLEILENSESKI